MIENKETREKLQDYLITNSLTISTDLRTSNFYKEQDEISRGAFLILANFVTKIRVKYNLEISSNAFKQATELFKDASSMGKFCDSAEKQIKRNFNILSGKTRYKGFPGSVKATPTCLLLADSILYYLGITEDPVFTPEDKLSEVEYDPSIKEAIKVKPLLVINEINNDFNSEGVNVVYNLLDSPVALSSGNQELLARLALEYDFDTHTLIKSTFNVNYCIMIASAIIRLKGKLSNRDNPLNKIVLDNYNDVLRIGMAITSLSKGDFTNDLTGVQPISVSTSQKKMLLRLFEKCDGSLEDLRQKESQWKTFYNNLDLSLSKYPNFKFAMKSLYAGDIDSINAKLERAIKDDDVDDLNSLGKAYPTMFVRNLLRIKSIDSIDLKPILKEVPTRILIQLYNRMLNYKALDYRATSYSGKTFFIDEDATTTKFSFGALMAVSEVLVGKVQKGISSFLTSHVKDDDGDETCFVLDKQYYDLAIPSTLKESNSHFNFVTPYTRKNIDMSNKDTIRLYTYWKNINNLRIDVDLSAKFYDKDFNYKGTVSYYNPKLDLADAVHSGDITNAPKGAVEAIDFNYDIARKNGVRFVTITDNVYTSETFKEIGTVSFGSASYKGSLSLYDPTCLNDVFSINGDTNFDVIAVYDLENNQVITIDSSLASSIGKSAENANSQGDGIANMSRWFSTVERLTIGDCMPEVKERDSDIPETVIPYNNEEAINLINTIIGDDGNE